MMFRSLGVKNPIYIEYRGNGQNHNYFKLKKNPTATNLFLFTISKAISTSQQPGALLRNYKNDAYIECIFRVDSCYRSVHVRGFIWMFILYCGRTGQFLYRKSKQESSRNLYNTGQCNNW